MAELDEVMWAMDRRGYVPDRFGRFAAEKLPDWKELRTLICDRYGIPTVRLVDWQRLGDWYMSTRNVGDEGFLAMDRRDLIAALRADRPGMMPCPPDARREVPVRDLVTLNQAAAMVHKSKRTLERYKTKGKLPSPSVPGGGGKPDLYDWSVMGPWLEGTFGIKMAAEFPAGLRPH